ncbi:MAG TPA: DUF3306 domain-containing protein [Sinorhizobium sp.]|nr:DUF3306 domain-containing protein [Sinorhizobium sp.]
MLLGTMWKCRSRSGCACPSTLARVAGAEERRVMAEGSESFFRRWARLKAERAKEEAAGPSAAGCESEALPETAPNTASQSQPAAQELPPIEELTKDSDFTPFLKEGVPENLKQLALRKLWRTDPAFANLDGLLEYGEDFAAPFRNPGPIATLFRIGRGMPGPNETEKEESEEAAQPGQADHPEVKPLESPEAAKSSESSLTKASNDVEESGVAEKPISGPSKAG